MGTGESSGLIEPSQPTPDSRFQASPVEELIARYHELASTPLGIASARQLESELRRTNLLFGDRSICQVLRPYFLTPEDARRLELAVERLLGAFRKVLKAIEEEGEIRAQLSLTPEEEAVLAADRQPFEPDVVGRIDGFFIRDGNFKVIEYNAESPGGIAFGDTLHRIFRELPILQEIGKQWNFEAAHGLDNTYRELVLAHRARVGAEAASHPMIAIVDWRSAPTNREFELCAEHFRAQGSAAIVAEPSELTYDGHRLRVGETAIDVVYKRVLVKDLLRHGGAAHPLVRAVRDNAVTCASGFGVHVLFRKELFAFFWQERVRTRLSDDEKAVIAQLIPWTHFVSDSEVKWYGKQRPLLDVIREQRDRLVLKPTADYGGEGVVLGWLASQEEWEMSLKTALKRPSVVQERVALAREHFPVASGVHIVFEPFFVDLNPYVWGGIRSRGFGCRLASGEILNVTAGGGSAIPVFIASPGR